ncbi:hypothetical protein AURDEDRAFT_166379 [Auricularia subglabra TFB-10046 SS5]|uniref:BRCT domain-containing protein n=1 Tax=Auricularia subglabra (strain TFB-10046 / SS5) TaxID=717982 RepID=J0DDQ9_AURST|nr:hypothetical protein AURDEDRAFT_166379 [Auricularia subglabra TFB-10046 SS5]
MTAPSPESESTLARLLQGTSVYLDRCVHHSPDEAVQRDRLLDMLTAMSARLTGNPSEADLVVCHASRTMLDEVMTAAPGIFVSYQYIEEAYREKRLPNYELFGSTRGAYAFDPRPITIPKVNARPQTPPAPFVAPVPVPPVPPVAPVVPPPPANHEPKQALPKPDRTFDTARLPLRPPTTHSQTATHPVAAAAQRTGNHKAAVPPPDRPFTAIFPNASFPSSSAPRPWSTLSTQTAIDTHHSQLTRPTRDSPPRAARGIAPDPPIVSSDLPPGVPPIPIPDFQIPPNKGPFRYLDMREWTAKFLGWIAEYTDHIELPWSPASIEILSEFMHKLVSPSHSSPLRLLRTACSPVPFLQAPLDISRTLFKSCVRTYPYFAEAAQDAMTAAHDMGIKRNHKLVTDRLVLTHALEDAARRYAASRPALDVLDSDDESPLQTVEKAATPPAASHRTPRTNSTANPARSSRKHSRDDDSDSYSASARHRARDRDRAPRPDRDNDRDKERDKERDNERDQHQPYQRKGRARKSVVV